MTSPSEKSKMVPMLYLAVVLAWVTVVGLAALAVQVATQRAAKAETAFQGALAALERMQGEVVKIAKSRETVVVPAPDLGPYLERMGATMVGVAEKLAAGIGEILNGREHPEVLQPVVQAAEEMGQGQPDIWTPPWEDDAWVNPAGLETVDPFAEAAPYTGNGAG